MRLKMPYPSHISINYLLSAKILNFIDLESEYEKSDFVNFVLPDLCPGNDSREKNLLADKTHRDLYANKF